MREEFTKVFGPGPTRLFFAPGRVNLIGEHTDYTGGYVFPAALSFGTWAVVCPRRDGVYSLASTGFPERVVCRRDGIRYRQEDGWANYPKGVIRQFAEKGATLKGADILFHGDMPRGAGLSSSASIELATAVALAALEEGEWPMLDLVRMAQRAENEFIGVQSGIMDQFSSGMGKADHAILLNCRTLAYRYVPLELKNFRLVIVHTNKTRTLTDSKYNERHRECLEGFRQLRHRLPFAGVLGEVKVEDWVSHRNAVESGLHRKRLKHVVTENRRVVDSAAALESGDLFRFGELMKESHRSLRDDYEVTGPELDVLFEAASSFDGCIGARMTGAGFGGCTVNLVHRDRLRGFREHVTERYSERTGRNPLFYPAEIGEGAREITEEE
ncbi:galactokinase [Melghirimyces profundicolus]|uniref:galactokinase n=1 Tax=Melghirimyces profundicolus TaxID=1242148 RepID=UPI003CCC1D1A